MAKGSSFERLICTTLSLWWTKGSTDGPCEDIFWRTSGSGARATTRAKKGKRTNHAHGDVTFIDPCGKPLIDVFCIEIKRGYGKFSITDLIDGGFKAEKGYEEWIRKLQDKCDLLGTPYWLLIHRKDNRQAMVYFPLVVWEHFFGQTFHIPDIRIKTKVDGIRHNIAGCRLEWLLDNITRQDIENLAERMKK